MSHWTSAQTKEHMKQRRVTTADALERALVQEMFLMESTQLTLLTPRQLSILFRRVDVAGRNPELKTDHPLTPTEQAWLIILTVVRDNIPHHVVRRKLIIDLPRPQRRRKTVNTCLKSQATSASSGP